MTAVRERLTFANVMSVTAVFIALGGSAIAINKIKANSVGSKQIKTGGVKNADLADNSVTSPKVENGSLKSEDFGANQLPAGATGPQGPQGTQGTQGPTGTVDTSNFYDKTASDARFLGIGATAANSDQLGGNIPASFPKAVKGLNTLVETGAARIGFARRTLPAGSGMTPIAGASFIGSVEASCSDPAQPSFRFSNDAGSGTVDVWIQNMIGGAFGTFASVPNLGTSATVIGTGGTGGQSRFNFIVGTGNTAGTGQTKIVVFDVVAVALGTNECTIQVQSQAYTLA
jgi:hypothetical protein